MKDIQNIASYDIPFRIAEEVKYAFPKENISFLLNSQTSVKEVLNKLQTYKKEEVFKMEKALKSLKRWVEDA